MIRRLILALALLPLAGHALDFDLNAKSAILINGNTGAVLYEKQADALHPPASMAKIVTALVLIEERGDHLHQTTVASREAVVAISYDAIVKSGFTKPSYWLDHEASHMGIKRGEQLKLNVLLDGLMIASADDGANVIAEYVGGTIPNFIDMMNARVGAAGCKHSYFTNPHGLHHPKMLTTARDMAKLGQVAMANPKFREVVVKRSAPRPSTNLQGETVMKSTLRPLHQGKYHHPHIIGMKTGFHSTAGYNVVLAADNGDRYLIGVLLGSESDAERWKDAHQLFDKAFEEEKVTTCLLEKGPQRFSFKVKGGRGKVSTELSRDLVYTYYPSEEVLVHGNVVWNNLASPIAKGEVVGYIQLLDSQDRVLRAEPLVAAGDVRQTLVATVGARWHESKPFRGMLVLTGVGVAAWFISGARKRSR